jgi:hypothetical protein
LSKKYGLYTHKYGIVAAAAVPNVVVIIAVFLEELIKHKLCVYIKYTPQFYTITMFVIVDLQTTFVA